MNRYLTAVFALGLFASPVHGAVTTGSATVKVLQAVTVTKGADLDFGKVVTGQSASTVRVAEDGSRSCGAGLTCIGPTSSALFNITGTANESVMVSIDQRRITLAASNTLTMTVDLTVPTDVIVLHAGKGSFRVGGTLNVGPNQAAGTYTGTFMVSVDYQ